MAAFSRDEEAFYKAFGEAVRRARKERGLSQDALASAVGLKRTSIANIERGRQRLLLHTAWSIALVLRVKLIDLLPSVPAASGTARAPAKLPSGLTEKERAFIEAAIGITAEEGVGDGDQTP